MKDVYLDTSVLVSLYVEEPFSKENSEQLRSLTGALLISELVTLEFYAALAMKQRMGVLTETQRKSILALFKGHMADQVYSTVKVNSLSFEMGIEFLADSKFTLRSLDTLHLAIAKQIGARLFTTDQQLRNAAQQCGVGLVI